MEFNKEMLNIVFLARGGQGAKSATEILAEAAVREGKFVKAFPEFGPERSGAPIKTYLRLSEKEIRTAEPILKPDILVVLDETILSSEKITESISLDPGAVVIINSAKNSSNFNSVFKNKVYTLDAASLSMKIIGKPTPNVSILGYLIKVTELVKLKSAAEIFRNIFNDKIGKEMTEKNIQAMEEAYDSM